MSKCDHGATTRTAIARSGCQRCGDADTIPGDAGASPDDDNAGDHAAAGTTCRAGDTETHRRSSRTSGVSCANAGQHVLCRGLLPQQRRQLCPPASASRHRPAGRHRAVQGRHLQLQPTSARHLLKPPRRRAMVVISVNTGSAARASLGPAPVTGHPPRRRVACAGHWPAVDQQCPPRSPSCRRTSSQAG